MKIGSENKGKSCAKPTSIYCCCDPLSHELRYIGKTVKDVKARVNAHVNNSKVRSTSHSASWFRKVKNPYFFILEVIPPFGNWIEAEQFWIAYFKSLGANLTNHTIGGEGMTGYELPPEHRAKISASNMGKILGPRTEEERLNLSEKLKGRKKPPRTKEHAAKIAAKLKGSTLIFTAEHCANLSKSQMGKGKDIPLSKEHRAKISLANTGRVVSEQGRANMSAAQLGLKRKSPTEESKLKRIESLKAAVIKRNKILLEVLVAFVTFFRSEGSLL